MSGIVMGLVLEQPITEQFTRGHKFIAVVYGDHAWEDGTHAYPAVESVARKTGYDERSIQRFLRDLEAMGMLIPDGRGPRGTNQYKFPLLKQGGKFWLAPQPIAPPKQGGDTMSPPQNKATKGGDSGVTGDMGVTGGGDIPSGDMDSGDSHVTRSNKPSLRTYEEEEGEKPQKFALSIKLQRALTNANVFKSTWPEIDRLMAQGWTEVDLFALIAASHDRRENGGQLVKRIREGSKAPERYYPLEQAEDVAQDDDQMIVTDDAGEEWKVALLMALRPNCRRADYAVLEQAQIYRDGSLVRIGIREGAPDVFQDRFARTIENFLAGAFALPTRVLFVSAETEPA